MIVLIKKVLIITIIMYLINMKVILLKRCCICIVLCYGFHTILFLIFKSFVFLFLNFTIKEVLNETSINSHVTLQDFYFLAHKINIKEWLLSLKKM